MSRLGDERGFTLVELLVAMGLMTVVLGAVLTTFEGFESNQRKTVLRNEAQESARRATDQIARELRNAVGVPNAAGTQLSSVERSGPYDLVFQTVGAVAGTTTNPTGRQRVRYCLRSNGNGSGDLLRQVQNFPGAPTAIAPTDTACPLTGWTATQVVAPYVTNADQGTGRDLFRYGYSGATPVASELDRIRSEIFVDVTPGAASPAEVRLRSAVTLRNANQPPEAMFTVLGQPGGISVDGSASSDPERQTLTYEWFVNSSVAAVNAQTAPNATGVRARITLGPGTHYVRLRVTDHAGQSNPVGSPPPTIVTL